MSNVSDQDYFQAFEVLTATIADMRRRIIALEARDAVDLEDRIDTIAASLKENNTLANWIVDIVEGKIDDIDWESKINDNIQDDTIIGALSGHSVTMSFD